MTTPRTVAVVGGGPAGLMAAEVLSAAGVPVTLYERMPSVGRKFLMAGRGGLNLTHSEELEAFLAEGSPPVYVGFGSMADRDPRRLAATVFEGLDLAGRRGVVLSGWAGLGRGDVPRHVFMVEDVPHAWLFPRMAAVVHHGGAGTTAAGLRAGVPSIVTPVFGDHSDTGAHSRHRRLNIHLPAVDQYTASRSATYAEDGFGRF